MRMRVKLKLQIIKLLSVMLLVAVCHGCTGSHYDEDNSTSSKLASAFDILGKSGGENSLRLKKYANEGYFKVGSKYKIKGKYYRPKVNIDYNETGYASWYGPGFHGKTTANGAKYNQNDYTAAHRTLPMPSVVRVVNLDNHRSVKVVINDRGPYHHVKGKARRIIDLSKKAAYDLGIMKKGTGKVKVEYLHDETMEMLAKMSPKQRQKAELAYEDALTRYVAMLYSGKKK